MNTDHLTEGWPDDPGRTEAEEFARGLQSQLPQLPAESMIRIEDRLRDALSKRQRTRRVRYLIAASIAACLLLAFAAIRPWRSSEQPLHPLNPPTAPRELVRDSFRVPVMAPPAPQPGDQPLINIDAYQGLYLHGE